MSITSHVQNSKFVIKRFKISNSNGNVKALMLNDWTIKEKGPMETGTIEDYFTSDTEQYLCQKYESPVGQTVDDLIKSNAAGVDYTITAEKLLQIKRFLVMMFIRRPSFLNDVYNATTIAKELGAKPSPSEFVKLLENTNLVDDLLGKLNPVLLYNKNKNGRVFISSIKGFSLVSKGTILESEWWLPFTPDFGIAFIGDELFEQFFDKNSCVDLEDDRWFDYYNERIAEHAIHDGDEFVFTSKESELDITKNKFEPKPSPSSK